MSRLWAAFPMDALGAPGDVENPVLSPGAENGDAGSAAGEESAMLEKKPPLLLLLLLLLVGPGGGPLPWIVFPAAAKLPAPTIDEPVLPATAAGAGADCGVEVALEGRCPVEATLKKLIPPGWVGSTGLVTGVGAVGCFPPGVGPAKAGLFAADGSTDAAGAPEGPGAGVGRFPFTERA